MRTRKLLVLFLIILSAVLSYAEQLQTPVLSEWTPLTSREEVEGFLRTATVTKAKYLGVGVANPMKLTLENGTIQHFGVFKAIDERKMGLYKLAGTQEFDFKDSWMFEVAAYELDKALGLNMVPPTVERIYEGKKGSVQWWVPNAMTEGD
ncbi:MAG TPA: hypothetical protein VJ521_13060, partial [Acidobacteriota bacterium]|nr:hypothetical protein [Acidobacteriota bacterium]